MIIKRLTIRLLASILALTAIPAHAESNIVTGTSTNAYNAINFLATRGEGPLLAKDAEIVKRGVLADTQVDAGERAMLDLLIAGKAFLIKHPKNDNERQFNRLASEEAKVVLRGITGFAYDDPILQNWMEATPQSVGKVLALYNGTADERQMALDTLVKRAETVWKEDSSKNDYRTLKSEMASWSARCNTQSGAAYRTCRTMVYEVMVTADRGLDGSTNGGIPDFIYSRFKPKEE